MGAELAARIALGRAIRTEAERMVATRGQLAEPAAWLAARAPGLAEAERGYRKAVAVRVSRILALARREPGGSEAAPRPGSAGRRCAA